MSFVHRTLKKIGRLGGNLPSWKLIRWKGFQNSYILSGIWINRSWDALICNSVHKLPGQAAFFSSYLLACHNEDDDISFTLPSCRPYSSTLMGCFSLVSCLCSCWIRSVLSWQLKALSFIQFHDWLPHCLAVESSQVHLAVVQSYQYAHASANLLTKLASLPTLANKISCHTTLCCLLHQLANCDRVMLLNLISCLNVHPFPFPMSFLPPQRLVSSAFLESAFYLQCQCKWKGRSSPV